MSNHLADFDRSPDIMDIAESRSHISRKSVESDFTEIESQLTIFGSENASELRPQVGNIPRETPTRKCQTHRFTPRHTLDYEPRAKRKKPEIENDDSPGQDEMRFDDLENECSTLRPKSLRSCGTPKIHNDWESLDDVIDHKTRESILDLDSEASVFYKAFKISPAAERESPSVIIASPSRTLGVYPWVHPEYSRYSKSLVDATWECYGTKASLDTELFQLVIQRDSEFCLKLTHNENDRQNKLQSISGITDATIAHLDGDGKLNLVVDETNHKYNPAWNLANIDTRIFYIGDQTILENLESVGFRIEKCVSLSMGIWLMDPGKYSLLDITDIDKVCKVLFGYAVNEKTTVAVSYAILFVVARILHIRGLNSVLLDLESPFMAEIYNMEKIGLKVTVNSELDKAVLTNRLRIKLLSHRLNLLVKRKIRFSYLDPGLTIKIILKEFKLESETQIKVKKLGF